MQIITRELPEKEKLTKTFVGLKFNLEAAKLPIERKNSVYATVSKLRKKGFSFETKVEGKSILIWRTA